MSYYKSKLSTLLLCDLSIVLIYKASLTLALRHLVPLSFSLAQVVGTVDVVLSASRTSYAIQVVSDVIQVRRDTPLLKLESL